MAFRSNIVILLPMILSSVSSFSTQSPPPKSQHIQTSTDATHTNNNNNGINRRQSISTLLSGITVAFTGVQTASAKDELFKPNPLTNKFLEQVRILEQAEADNLVYKGELAPGSPPLRSEYANLLVPILTMQQDLTNVDGLIHEVEGKGLMEANGILNRQEFEKIKFKKTFNAFGTYVFPI